MAFHGNQRFPRCGKPAAQGSETLDRAPLRDHESAKAHRVSKAPRRLSGDQGDAADPAAPGVGANLSVPSRRGGDLMLSSGVLQSSAQAGTYYAQDNYYTK